jgi:hypothetical protein
MKDTEDIEISMFTTRLTKVALHTVWNLKEVGFGFWLRIVTQIEISDNNGYQP